MFFTKFPHPANFSFVESYDEGTGTAQAGGREFTFQIQSYQDGHFHLGAKNPDMWLPNRCLAPLNLPSDVQFNHVCRGAVCDFALMTDDGQTIVQSVPGKGFGVCGEASLFQFEVPDDALFFGMGEKCFGRLELSGIRTKFWNTDVWSDFHWGQWGGHAVDPPYFSTPYLAMRTSKGWVGFLLHNPGVTFMETPGKDSTRVFVEWQRTSRHLILGSENGEPNLWVLHAPSLLDLTRKLQKLVGVTPRPPLWSLGFHQSRWGYGGHKDLLDLDKKFTKYEIPCSGLWLDLDYMNGFRIFDVDKRAFPKGVQTTADVLAKSGRRIVPIIDPGVKQEKGYAVYDDGAANGVFCRNPEGNEYVGLVWPGETVFPDFTQAKGRDWWARYAQEFRQSGFGACWVDMNDPSTGPVDPIGMLFNDGSEPHALHRNQYALGMQMATIQGFLNAVPDERPFVLSRSGFIGSSQFSAVWTGDNVSNEFYLQQSLPTTLGMSISGLPFNGPDIGGFGGDADDELMVRWFQAAFLFPFCRNHSTLDSRLEEPWQYPASVRKVITHYIRLRYQFLPYLYQLFVRQESTGDPMARPLICDFDDPAYADIHDEFLVGPDLLQAPVLNMGATQRQVTLPGAEPWFDLGSGRWLQPGVHTLKAGLSATGLYARAGSLVTVSPEPPTTTETDLSRPLVLVLVPEGWTGTRTIDYVFDDGLSFGYRRGEESRLDVTLTATAESLQIETRHGATGFGQAAPTFAWPETGRTVTVNGATVESSERAFKFSGKSFTLRTTGSD